MEDTHLEEGEACYYKDDTSVDPDIALSCLDEKLHSVLGHFQKDFEGGVSAENLGAKFGGYGSFLPTYERSPSVRPQSKTPQRVQNFSLPRSHDVLPIERAPQNSTAPSDAAQSLRASTPTSVDPDIALSYLDEKLHSVLGHFQKDFEGGVSAENLGAKFGGYGSFLPTYQRSLSVRPQSKTPQRVQNFSSPRSHDVLPIERAPQNSTAPSDAAQSLRASTPTSVDPDIALSYLDEKLHSVLGHFQKDFEGGVSAENLGAKFGGYGSFLPTYERSPSVRPQSRTPQRVQNFSSPRSHDVLPIQRAPQNSTAPSDAAQSLRASTPTSSKF